MAPSSWQNWHLAEETWLQQCPSQAVRQGKDSVRSELFQDVLGQGVGVEGGGGGGAGWLNSTVQRHIALVIVAQAVRVAIRDLAHLVPKAQPTPEPGGWRPRAS